MVELIVIAIFISVALLSWAALYPILSRHDVVRERVARLARQEEEQTALLHTPKRWQLFFARFGERVKTNPTDLHTYRELMTAAGFRSQSVYVFLGSKIFLAIALPAIFLIMFALPNGRLLNLTSIILALTLAIAGYLVPSLWISRRAESRKREIFHALPDVLDLLTVCVEAGLSLDAALVKTAENFQAQENPLIQEINTTTLEIRAGRSRAEALRAMADRTMVDDIKALVSMLIQTDKFGTSLGKTLRTYSDSLRTKRKQLAEEAAAKTAVKMLFPLTFFVFPALLVVMLAPAFIKIVALFNK